MTTVEVTGTVVAEVSPQLGTTTAVITYSKSNVGDTLEVGGDLAITSILFAHATDDGAGANDPITWSGTTVTFSAETGAGRILIIGK